MARPIMVDIMGAGVWVYGHRSAHLHLCAVRPRGGPAVGANRIPVRPSRPASVSRLVCGLGVALAAWPALPPDGDAHAATARPRGSSDTRVRSDKRTEADRTAPTADRHRATGPARRLEAAPFSATKNSRARVLTLMRLNVAAYPSYLDTGDGAFDRTWSEDVMSAILAEHNQALDAPQTLPYTLVEESLVPPAAHISRILT